jgi:hypothetical protein
VPKSLEQQVGKSGSDVSDSDEDGAYGGMSVTACNLGMGACLYLQIMKTLAILFFILSVINIPILLTYANSTKGNEYGDLEKIFSYFTMGNLGRSN